jgi:xylan 1,4-beta-xylosidase
MTHLTACVAVILGLCVLACAGEAAPQAATLTVDFGKELGPVQPRTGFLGGLRDEFPDELIQPLNPKLWRIGHQFRGRIKAGLTGAITRVDKLGARYKLVMSDLITSWPAKGKDWKDFDWTKYEADVKKLVAQVGELAPKVIWEPVNEPDCNTKPIEKYYELYGHAFKALREANKDLDICGPGFAFPNYEKYQTFLNYCRENKLECNYLAWHFTGWDPNVPEQGKWKLGQMREFLKTFPEQKIKEIHCDEWGAGPDKPGRLHPGRAIVWFHYLENVYQVERACRANWGDADDYLGGIVTKKGEPYPVYHAYRWYAAAQDQTRVEATGNTKVLACLASKTADRCEIVVGSIQKGITTVTLELKGVALADPKVDIRRLPNANLDTPLTEADIPAFKDFKLEKQPDGLRLTLPKVEENEAYRVVLTK